MSRPVLAVLVLCAALAPAVAADLPSKVALPPAPVLGPSFTWSGFYTGVQGGYAWGLARETRGLSARYSPDGFVGGAHAGFNVAHGALVLGAEGDLEAAGIDADTERGRRGARATLDAQGSVRGRVGFAADRFLIYGTGGLALAHLRFDQLDARNAPRERATDVETGWTAGAGVEWAFTDQLTARLEYRYARFDALTNVSRFSLPPTLTTQDLEQHTARAGVSYKF